MTRSTSAFLYVGGEVPRSRQAASEAILTKIQQNSASRLSYAFESWLFHYIAEDGLVYLAVADAELGRRVPFAFLTQLQKDVRGKRPHH